MENIAVTLRYLWNNIAEYKNFKASDIEKENELAGLMLDVIIKAAKDYVNPPVDTPQ